MFYLKEIFGNAIIDHHHARDLKIQLRERNLSYVKRK